MKIVAVALFISSIVFILLIVLTSVNMSTQSSLIETDPYQLSTHVLDIGKGGPAKNVEVHLHSISNGNWTLIAKNLTDSNGRIKSFLPRKENPDNKGVFKLVFFTEPYFKESKQATFFPQIEVIFNITDETHYHVPITLSNFGYSTYRGS